jgi:hypothetical protein
MKKINFILKLVFANILFFFLSINYIYSQYAGITTIGTVTACSGTVFIPLTITNSPPFYIMDIRLLYEHLKNQ